ncbi:alpha/beta fold hydrolase [Streptomyces sp. NPDC003327]
MPSGSRGRVVSADGTEIAYERYGDGPPVVLVSGPLRTAVDERPLAALLARGGFSVVAYDRRGRGASGDTGPYAVEREVEDLAAVVAEAGAGAALHGADTGGALALAAVAAGVATGPVAVFEPPYAADAGVRLRAAAELVGRGRRDAALDLLLAATGGVPGRARSALAELAHTLAYDGAMLDAVLYAGTVPAEVHARVLVVDGGASPAPTRRAALALTSALPRARHRTLTGQTHQVAPHVLAPVLVEFLAEERAASEAA